MTSNTPTDETDSEWGKSWSNCPEHGPLKQLRIATRKIWNYATATNNED